MNEPKVRAAPAIDGHMIDLDVGHSLALYQRSGEPWVAEFRGGRGSIMQATTWFRLYATKLRYGADSRYAKPLPQAVLEAIERLHAEAEARDERMLDLARTAVTAVRRHWIKMISRLRGGSDCVGT